MLGPTGSVSPRSGRERLTALNAISGGVTRNALVREALEATVDGRITPLDPHEKLRRALGADIRRAETALRTAFELSRNAARD